MGNPKILLLNPQTPYYEMRLMKRPSRVWQPISLGSIASLLEAEGRDFELLDANAMGMAPDAVAEHTQAYGPDIVVMNSAQHDRWQNPIPTVDHVLDMVTKLDGVAPDATFILLGPHGTAFSAHTFDRIPRLDYLVRGEPEMTTLELIRRLAAGESVDDLAGISVVVDGKCVDHADAGFLADLDELPMPAYHLLPMDRYRYRGEADDPGNEHDRFAMMVTSRGCPYRCAYCSLTMVGWKYRVRSVEKVLEEIDVLVGQYGVNSLIFHDQVLTLKKPRLIEMCEGLVERNYDLAWYCQGVVNKFPTDVLPLMHDAGCKQINFGLESGVEEVSGKMRKNSVQEFVQIYEAGEKAGVAIIPNHMVGLPGETAELARKSNEFYKKFGFKYFFASPTIPFPGTELYEIGRTDGTIKGETWDDVVEATGLVDNGFTKEEMQEIVDELFEEERRQEAAEAAAAGGTGASAAGGTGASAAGGAE